mgnify:CR=1 FL=1
MKKKLSNSFIFRRTNLTVFLLTRMQMSDQKAECLSGFSLGGPKREEEHGAARS